MKTKHLVFSIFFSFLSISVYTQIQKASIQYNIKFRLKNPNNKKDFFNNSDILNAFEDLKIHLLYYNNKSMLYAESMMSLSDGTDLNDELARTISGVKSAYFCDIPKNSIIRTTEFDGNKYIISSNFDKRKWILTNESKMIKGFKCYKATTVNKFISRKGDIVSKDIFAWYTPDISIPLGPKDYVGLPGLILELAEGQNGVIFYIEKIELNSKKKMTIKIPEDDNIITEDDFTNITKGSFDKFVKSMK